VREIEKREKRGAETSKYVAIHTDRDLEHLEREVLKLLGVGCRKTDEGIYYLREIGTVYIKGM